MQVLMEVCRFLMPAAMASWCSDLILPMATSVLMSSSMASQRFVARMSGRIFSLLRMSPKSIALGSVSAAISPEIGLDDKNEFSEQPGCGLAECKGAVQPPL